MMSNQLPEHQDVPSGAEGTGSAPSGGIRRVRRYVGGVASVAGVASLAAVAGMSGAPALASATNALGLPRFFAADARADGGNDNGGNDIGGQDPGGWRPEWDKDAKQVGCDSNELISALVKANAENGAKLKLAKGCTYSLTVFQGDDGLPVITQPIAIKGEGARIERAANAAPFRIFNVGPGGELTLCDLTIRGGDDRSGDGGGGLLVQSGGKAVVEKSAVVGNRSTGVGGGIANFGITAVVGEEKNYGDPSRGEDGRADGEDPQDQPKDAESPSAEADDEAPATEPAEGSEPAASANGSTLPGWTKDGWSKDGWDHDTSVYATRVSENSALGHGGGIYSSGALVVDGAEVSHNNTAQDGGGISNTGGTLSLSRSKIARNVAVGLGGGVHASGGAVTKIVYTGVLDNESTAPTAAGGGILSFNSSLYVRHSEVVRNNAGGLAGGIYNGGGQAVVEETKVADNTAQEAGGGLYNVDGALVVRRSLVDSNRTVGAGSQAGGIYTNGGTLALTESRVSRNDSVLPPGGIFADGTLVTVDDRTVIIDNRPTNCSGSADPVPNCFG